MIYIVGTNHELQHTAHPKRAIRLERKKVDVEEARNSLKSLLKELVRTAQPQLIAEEMPTFVLEAIGAKSNVKEVADELGIEHRFCDPEREEREVIGLPPCGTEGCDPETRRRLDERREEYWIERLSDMIDRDIIFVCGAEHVSSFQNLLEGKGVTTKVEERYFGRDIYEVNGDSIFFPSNY